MRKNVVMPAGFLFVLCLLSTVAMLGGAEEASAKAVPLPMNIVGTSWAGEMTTVDSKGNTTTREVTVAFATQEGNFISGTMTDTGTNEIIVAFSGIIGPLNPYFLHLTGPNSVLQGDVVRGGRTNRLFIRGGDTSAGTSSMGVLIRQ